MILTLPEFVDEIGVAIHMKVTEQYFPAQLFWETLKRIVEKIILWQH